MQSLRIPERISAEIEKLQLTIGYRFTNEQLLIEALVHRSFYQEQKQLSLHGDRSSNKHNERLEFLGDSVLSIIISEELYRRSSRVQDDEGVLSKKRSRLVNEGFLARLAKKVGLDQCLLLSKQEEINAGRDRASTLADAFEALTAAIYLDSSLENTSAVVRRIFPEDLLGAEPETDYKTELQEWVQARTKRAPQYRVLEERGPSHAKEFEVAVMVGSELVGVGRGGSKKLASQRAAAQALKHVQALKH